MVFMLLLSWLSFELVVFQVLKAAPVEPDIESNDWEPEISAPVPR